MTTYESKRSIRSSALFWLGISLIATGVGLAMFWLGLTIGASVEGPLHPGVTALLLLPSLALGFVGGWLQRRNH